MNDIDPRQLTSTWTLKAGDLEVKVDGDDDAANFNQFLEGNPQVKAALIRAIENGADPGYTEKVFKTAMERFTGVPAGVHAPTPLKTAFTKYLDSRSALAENKDATILEKKKMLEMFADFLIRNKRDPGVMEVSSLRRPELIDFVQEYASRKGKLHSLSGKIKSQLSVRTVQKLIGQLKDFFGYAVAQEWCSTKRGRQSGLWLAREQRKIYDPNAPATQLEKANRSLSLIFQVCPLNYLEIEFSNPADRVLIT